jgi:hypothetical protein
MSAFTVAIGVPAITDTGAIGLSPFMATEATGIMDTEAIAATATTPAGDDSGRLNLLRWSR